MNFISAISVLIDILPCKMHRLWKTSSVWRDVLVSAGISSQLKVSDVDIFLQHRRYKVTDRRLWNNQRYHVFSSTPYFPTPRDQINSKSAVKHFCMSNIFRGSPSQHIQQALSYLNTHLGNDVESSQEQSVDISEVPKVSSSNNSTVTLPDSSDDKGKETSINDNEVPKSASSSNFTGSLPESSDCKVICKNLDILWTEFVQIHTGECRFSKLEYIKQSQFGWDACDVYYCHGCKKEFVKSSSQ